MADTEVDIETAKRLYVDYSQRVADLKAQLKPLQKELKKNERIIKKHMEDNDLQSFVVGEFSFEKKLTTRFRCTKEDLEELLENPEDAEAFVVEQNSISRKKRRRDSE